MVEYNDLKQEEKNLFDEFDKRLLHHRKKARLNILALLISKHRGLK